ncbi:MAG: hemolysin III family protein [Chloroflexota bacterium]
MLSKIREPFNGISHLAGAITAFFGGITLLVIGWTGMIKIISVIIYSISLISMFSASATYHLTNVKPHIEKILRKVDHSAIFLLIAGTYTPFCMNAFTGFWRWGFLSIIWGIAAIGIMVKIFYIGAPRWLNAAMYVLMGWISILAVRQMAALPLGTLIWLIVGGVIYTFGAVVYATKIFNFVPGKFGFHEVWHLFVIGGALAHYISVLLLLNSLS